MDYFTADWHLGHNNIIKYCNRPFSSIEEMNSELICRYNKKVGNKDTCYFVGDIGFYGHLKLIKQLNGRKILILGNHDRESTKRYYDSGFDAVLYKADILTNKNRFHLSHCPNRTLLELTKLLFMYTYKMYKKNKTFKDIYLRLRREIKQHPLFKRHTVICGHVHDSWKIRNNNINVGVDVWDYMPVSINQVLTEKRKIK